MSNNGSLDGLDVWPLSSPKLAQFFRLVLNHHLDGGRQYFEPHVSPVPQEKLPPDVVKAKLQELITLYAPQFAKSSVPFWNPDYIAHTNLDKSMPGIVRYLTTLLFNPNNIALEASPLTPILQVRAGRQLCNMVGYNTNVDKKPVGWGHFTTGTAIANMEFMWAARNLKFYPLSLRKAMEGELSLIADIFKASTCDGTEKLLKDFNSWELLNMNPADILDIPGRLCDSTGVSLSFLENSIKPYLIPAIGKDELEKDFKIATPAVYFASATIDYSWQKGADITGIGSNIVTIEVDNAARMNTSSLERSLEDCLRKNQAVIAVIAVIGSTEHGSCDPLKEIIRIREKYRQKGLSFVLHADAAWGAYFTTACPPTTSTKNSGIHNLLKPATIESLRQLHLCDSITIDPHKSGYIQYQAGGLVYRDERIRRFVTWRSSIAFKKEDKTEIYGIEESNLGAAPVAAYFFHKTIGLNGAGYGQLLTHAVFNAFKMYAYLVSMEDPAFIVTTFNMLPAETSGGDVTAAKAQIADLLSKSSSSGDELLVDLARDIGSDLCINAFAVNFRSKDGQVNNVVEEANYLNERIFEELSVSSQQTDLTTLPLVLTSTRLVQSKYGRCLTNFKTRMGLEGDQDLFVLLNVTTSPIPTPNNVFEEITSALRHTIKDKCQISLHRNTLTPTIHRFLMQGTDTVFLVYFSMFNMENHRTQLVITGQLSSDVMRRYTSERARDPAQVFTLACEKQETLDHILQRRDFRAVIHKGIPNPGDEPLIQGFTFTNIRILFKASLGARDLKPYPHSMPFLVYGTTQQRHITHVFTASPNAHLSADQIKISDYIPQGEGPIYVHLNYSEIASQPFASTFPVVPANFFFRSDAVLTTAKFTNDIDGETVLGNGRITLTKNVYVDTHWLNLDPILPGQRVPVTQDNDWNNIIDGIEEEIARDD